MKRVYEDIREQDTHSRSPPVETSTVYTSVKYTNTNGVETSDDYSVITAAGSQHRVREDSKGILGFSFRLCPIQHLTT